MLRFFTLILLIIPLAGEGQILFQGFVKDSVLNEGLPFANIGILGTSKGTNSDRNGAFSIELSKSDTLRISYVGYKMKQLTFDQLIENILLKPYSETLDEVVVQARKERTYTFKNGNSNRKTFLTKGGANQYATLVKNNERKTGFLKEIVFYLQPGIKSNNRFESLIRLRVYTNENGLPGKDLMLKSIEKRVSKGTKKLKFDVLDFLVPHPMDGIFIGLDLIGYYDNQDNYHPYSTKNIPYDTRIDFVIDNEKQYLTFSKFFGTRWNVTEFRDNKGNHIRVVAKFLSKSSY